MYYTQLVTHQIFLCVKYLGKILQLQEIFSSCCASWVKNTEKHQNE